MRTIPFVRWIANAAARLTGPHGAVTQQARKAGCSRQSVYSHAEKVNAAVQAEHGGGPTRAKLIEESAPLRRENAQLWAWLFQTIEFPPAKQQEFAVTALGACPRIHLCSGIGPRFSQGLGVSAWAPRSAHTIPINPHRHCWTNAKS